MTSDGCICISLEINSVDGLTLPFGGLLYLVARNLSKLKLQDGGCGGGVKEEGGELSWL